jgi:aconitate hydratase
MLGQPLHMQSPPVIGVRLTGCLPERATATDLVLTVTAMLRARGVVGMFVEFFGPGLSRLSVPDRTTVANMAPEYGATMGFFPVDAMTLEFLRHTGRPPQLVELVERYCRAQGLFRTDDTLDPQFCDIIDLDLGAVRPCLAGPSRPQDRVALDAMPAAWNAALRAPAASRGFDVDLDAAAACAMVELPDGSQAAITHGAVVLASITSCTNTSNPAAMLAAGLLARNAAARGLRSRPWVKTSLAPGSTAVTAYLRAAGLLEGLERLGFHVAGYGCATCIGNSGPLPEAVQTAISDKRLIAAAVVSGNRNFEGRIHPLARACYLASPPLVVAYALAGTIDIDLQRDPLGTDRSGKPVYLQDIWPPADAVNELCRLALDPAIYEREYADIERACAPWNAIALRQDTIFDWDEASTYIQHPSFFDGMPLRPGRIEPIRDARVLALLGDSVTTDHISPAGAIPPSSPAGRYLIERGVAPGEFNSYGSRRGNHHVMARGTFAHIRLRNLLVPGTEGGWTACLPDGPVMTIYEAAMRYRAAGTACIVIAGRDYGMGSSRDWAAKGTRLLGVRAVIAESYERIHRSNLVGMGVLPLQFESGRSAAALGLSGRERYTIAIGEGVRPGCAISVTVLGDDGAERTFTATCRLDSMIEVEYYRHGGILPAVLRGFLAEQAAGNGAA